MRIAICDDDKIMLDILATMVADCMQRYEEQTEIVTYLRATELVKDNSVQAYDAVFLDIEMPEMSGEEAAKCLREKSREQIIIFATNYEHLVFRSFSARPLRFLRKDHLKRDLSEAISAMLDEHAWVNDRIVLEYRGEIHTFLTREIRYCETYNHETIIHTVRESITLRMPIKNMEKLLCARGFVRTHKSYLVNMRYMCSLGKEVICLSNPEETLPLSRRRVKDVREKFLIYLPNRGI